MRETKAFRGDIKEARGLLILGILWWSSRKEICLLFGSWVHIPWPPKAINIIDELALFSLVVKGLSCDKDIRL